MLKFICYSKCTTCQKAKKWLDSNNINYEFRDIKTENPTIEDTIRQYSELGAPARSEKDRSFDDLTRLYFVAFSRAESVLLLVGLNNSLTGFKHKNKLFDIPNVALGWSRDKQYVGFNEIYLI